MPSSKRLKTIRPREVVVVAMHEYGACHRDADSILSKLQCKLRKQLFSHLNPLMLARPILKAQCARVFFRE